MNDVLKKYSEGDMDKSSEYFNLKKAAKDIRAQVTDLKTQHEDYEELQQLNKKAKELRDNIKEDEQIAELSEKLKEVKERIELLKEMIRIELIETAQNEIEVDGKILKLVYVIKEGKGE